MILLVAILIVAATVNHAFRGTNPRAFMADVVLVLLLCAMLSC